MFYVFLVCEIMRYANRLVFLRMRLVEKLWDRLRFEKRVLLFLRRNEPSSCLGSLKSKFFGLVVEVGLG